MLLRLAAVWPLLLLQPFHAACGMPEDIVPLTAARVTFSGTPILDRQGQVLGVTIPLKRAGRLLLLEGTLDNHTGNFVLDTGASGLVLNTTYFRNAIPARDEEGGGVTGSTGIAMKLTVRKLAISDLVYDNVPADVIPLGHLESRRGVKILGLFGMSLLKNVEMVIDVRKNELQVFRLNKAGDRLLPTPEKITYDIIQKIEVVSHVMFVQGTIGGRILDFCIDTGAESNVLDIRANKKVLDKITITRRSELSGAGTGRGEVLYGTITDFSLGGRPLVPMETIVCSLDAMSQKYGCPIDGMLGFDFFMKGKVFINLVKKVMYVSFNREGA